MSLLVGHSLCARDLVSSAFGLQIRRSSLSENKRSLRWDSPKAAIISNFHLPMHSLEFKTRTSLEDIKRLKLITAIKTPYLPDGRFDLEAYDSLIQMQIANGVEGVVVGGTTGEGHLMSRDERIMLIAHTITCFGAMLKVIGGAGAGSNSTREAIRAAEQGFAVGMHAALHIYPCYGKTSMEGLLYHFESLLSIGPTIIYNAPSRTGQDVPPTVIYSVAENPKECMGFDRIEDYVARGLTIWSGDDDRRRNAGWVSGSTGVISVASNLVPGMMHDLMFKGANSSLSTKLTPLFEWLCCEPNPIGLNTALAQLGVIRPIFRLPYVPLQLEERVSFVKIVESIGRENFVGEKDVQALEGDDFILLPRY